MAGSSAAKKKKLQSGYNFTGQQTVERFLTLFIISIFCLSAWQVVVLVNRDVRTVATKFAGSEAGRSNRMLLTRSAQDLEMVVLGYYVGGAHLTPDDIDRQVAYLMGVVERVAIDEDATPVQEELIASLHIDMDRLATFAALPLPLNSAQQTELIDLIADFRMQVRKIIDHMLVLRGPVAIPELGKQHKFLMSSIISMATSGLGLIVLLLMKLRVTEKLLRERQNLSNLLEPRMAAIETAMDGVAITDAEGRLRYVNQALTDYHGYESPDMLVNCAWRVLYDEEQQDWFAEQVMPLLQREGFWRGHCRGRRKDGSYFHQDVAIAALHDGGLVFVVRDYTELLESIMLSNRRLAAIEAARDGIGIVDNDGKLNYINRAMRELHGLSEAEAESFIGQDWTAIYPPKGKRQIEDHVLPALLSNGHWQGEAPIVRADGSIISTELSLSLLPDGGFIGTTRDISERKKAEEEKEELQRQFYQAQKMEAIGRMAGGIAHDFNNILSSILGYAEFLMDDLEKECAQHGFARQIYSGGTQARHLVDQILAFSRRRGGGIDILSMADSLQNTASMLRPVVPPAIRLEVAESADNNILRANTTQLSQALMNLCVNAIDAMEDEKDGFIRLAAETISAAESGVPEIMLANELPKADQEPPVIILPQENGDCLLLCGLLARDENYVRVSVSDSGGGMDIDVMQHLFEPFFTTKPVDRGTGLGLSAVHGIVAGHRGALTVRSAPGKGTIFTLYFPQATGQKTSTPSLSEPVMQGTGRILVVDDQPDVATVTAQMLTRLGYEVDMALSGDIAIDLLREKPDAYNLIVTDYSMPEMTGVELAEAVYEDFPSLPILIMTGYGRKKLDHEMKDMPGIAGVVSKPLDRIILSQAVSKILQKARAA